MANLRAAISTNTMTLLNARISGSGSTKFSRRTALSLNWNVRVLEFRQQKPEILSQNAQRSNAVGRRKEMKAGLPWRRVQRSHMISLLWEADRWEADRKVREDGCVAFKDSQEKSDQRKVLNWHQWNFKKKGGGLYSGVEHRITRPVLISDTFYPFLYGPQVHVSIAVGLSPSENTCK